ncbi:MAG: NUDIX hydrolase [Caldisericaceae bacterium]
MEIVKKETIFSGRLLSLIKKTVKNSDGSLWDREVVTYGGNASVILPLVDNKVVFVKQFRPTVEDFILELPAGRIENNETPYDCAKRELEEETGLIAKNLKFLFEFYPSPGFVDEKLYLFLATEFSHGIVNLDAGEEVNTLFVPIDDALSYLDNGTIIDGKTIIGLLYMKLMLK